MLVLVEPDGVKRKEKYIGRDKATRTERERKREKERRARDSWPRGKNINPRKATHVSPYRLRDASNYVSIPSRWSTIKSSSNYVCALLPVFSLYACTCIGMCKSRCCELVIVRPEDSVGSLS